MTATWQAMIAAGDKRDYLGMFDAMAGVGVLPVPLMRDEKNKVKRPIGDAWGKTDLAERRKILANQIEKHPNNVGIGCQPVGYVVFDLDPPEKDPEKIPQIYDDFIEVIMGGEEHRTLSVRGEGGVHIWFKIDDEFLRQYADNAKKKVPMPSGGHVEVFVGSPSSQTQVACPPSEGKSWAHRSEPLPLPEVARRFLLGLIREKDRQDVPRREFNAPIDSWETQWFIGRSSKLVGNIEAATPGSLHYTLRDNVLTIAGYAAGMGCEHLAREVFDAVDDSLARNGNCHSFKVAKKTMEWAWTRGVGLPIVAERFEKHKGETVEPKAVIESVKPVRPDITPYHDPFKVAKTFVEHQLSHRILTWKGAAYQYVTGRYQEIRADELKAKIGSFSDHWYLINAENEFARIEDPKAKSSFKKRPVNAGVIQSVTQAFYSVSTVDESRLPSMPGWIDRMGDDWKPSETLALADCLLNVRTGEVKALTNRWFSRVRSPIRWNGGNPDCPIWQAFLESAFPNDADSVRLLQQYMGLCLTNDTSFQKILAMVGPPRSGKGTISRVLTAIIGSESVMSLAMSDLSREFGLERLIGVPVAIMPDVRFGSRDNIADAIERLLSISGEDEIRIARKYQSDWCGKLPTRIVMASNEMPRLPDAAAALPTRLLTLQFVESHLGKEDLELQPRLMSELPGILSWCCEGYRDLIESGAFARNEATARMTEEAREVGSPVLSFMRDCLEVTYSAESSVEIGDLYSIYQTWCARTGHKPASQTTLTKQIMDLEPKIRKARPGSREISRRRKMVGVHITNDARSSLSIY
jgi:P4 family phage/plasmid primase-like protien